MKKILFTLLLLNCSNLMANPILYSEENMQGKATTLQDTGGLDKSLMIHFSPPHTYRILVDYNDNRVILGSNGVIENKSLYVPQCWNVNLRILPKESLNFETPPSGYIAVYWLEDLIANSNLPEYIIFGSAPAQYDNFEDYFNMADEIIGYTATRDPNCEALVVSWLQYEYGSCSGASRQGFISWTGNGDSFVVEHKIAGRWSQIYSGRAKSMQYSGVRGSYPIRAKTVKDGVESPWRTSVASIPECQVGGGGAQPL